MKLLILITTYNRIDYLKQLVDSILKYKNAKHYYTIVINDDGSSGGTAEYINKLANTNKHKNISYKLNFSYHQNGHHANNALMLYGQHIDYDFGFKMDDDLFITKKGWEDIYINYAKETGYSHLVFHDYEWSNPNKITPSTCQGAFFTFTKEVIQKVGYIDELSFPRRGWGHGDWTARACRFGFNNEQGLHDAPNSNEYIKLQSRNNYVLTPNYESELKKAMRNAAFKSSLILNKSRREIKLQHCFLRYFFDHVYLLNMKRRSDRLMRMTNILNKYGIDFEVWTAIDGKTQPPHNVLSPGANGCALSHISILEDIKLKGYKRPLILEDDLIVLSNISKYAHHIYNAELNDFDILYLGASKWGFDVSEQHGVKVGKNIDGTFAYSVNGFKIDEILDVAKKNINLPIDTRLHEIHKRGKSLFVHPMYFIADVTKSDIRASRTMTYQAPQVGWDLKLYNYGK